jgi:surface protein
MFYSCQLITSLDLSSSDVGNVTENYTQTFYKMDNLTTFMPFKQWKRKDIYLSESKQLTPYSIHLFIENSASVADGATQRVLRLNADAKSNWEASEYYDADVAMANEKLITIA